MLFYQANDITPHRVKLRFPRGPHRRFSGVLWWLTRLLWHLIPPHHVPWANESIVHVCFVTLSQWKHSSCMLCASDSFDIHVCQNMMNQLIIGIHQRAWSLYCLALKCVLWSLIVWHSSVCYDNWLVGAQVCTVTNYCLAFKSYALSGVFLMYFWRV